VNRGLLDLASPEVLLDVEENQFGLAIPLLEHLITTKSGIPIPYMQLGMAYTWLKQYDKAILPAVQGGGTESPMD
jgi:hypothetical protein